MRPTNAQMVARLRIMASQFLSEDSEGKKFYQDVADELEELQRRVEGGPLTQAPEIHWELDIFGRLTRSGAI